MKNLTVWQTLIIAMVPAVVTIANAWALKLYEIRQSRKPKDAPDTTSEKQAKTTGVRQRIVLYLNVFGLLSSSIIIFSTILSPSGHQNLDAFVISLQVVIGCSNAWHLGVYSYEVKKHEVLLEIATVLDRHGAIAEKLVEANARLNDRVKALELKKKK